MRPGSFFRISSAGLPERFVTNLQHPSTKRRDPFSLCKRCLQCICNMQTLSSVGCGCDWSNASWLLTVVVAERLEAFEGFPERIGRLGMLLPFLGRYCKVSTSSHLEVGLIKFSSLHFLQLPIRAAVLQLEELTGIAKQNRIIPQIMPNVFCRVPVIAPLFILT